jgi:hypothetical protein
VTGWVRTGISLTGQWLKYSEKRFTSSVAEVTITLTTTTTTTTTTTSALGLITRPSFQRWRYLEIIPRRQRTLGEAEENVGVDAPLMRLIEHDEAVAREGGVLQALPHQAACQPKKPLIIIIITIIIITPSINQQTV